MKKIYLLLSLIFVMAPAALAERAVANIEGTVDNTLRGVAQFQETEDGLQIAAQFKNLPPGKHGFHIHEGGSCADEGKTAGGHFDPFKVTHGFLPKDGLEHAHVGDLGNIEIDENGMGSLRLTAPHLNLSEGILNVTGRSVIIHEHADDFGQPTGNAGGRIACGLIESVSVS